RRRCPRTVHLEARRAPRRRREARSARAPAPSSARQEPWDDAPPARAAQAGERAAPAPATARASRGSAARQTRLRCKPRPSSSRRDLDRDLLARAVSREILRHDLDRIPARSERLARLDERRETMALERHVDLAPAP